ncbi:MAG: hypothetical protein JST89_05080 [Cyanobacteria bacterium SZAS-4]|nr:hypothetical protein [Cyanobacteria bacterium SZAS-4]
MSRKEVSRTAVTILAALSISIGTGTFASAKSSAHLHHHKSATANLDGELIAGFPFRKSKDDAKANSVKDSDKESDNEKGKDPAKAGAKDEKAAAKADKEKNKDKDKDKNKDKDQDKQQSASVDKKKQKSDEKAAAKAQEEKEDAEKETAKLAKKSKKKKSKAEKKQKDEAADAARRDQAAADKAASDRATANKAKIENSENAKSNVNPQLQGTGSGAGGVRVRSGYTADAALISLLNDLARSLKDPSEQAKLGDEDQRFVVQMALDVLNKALESRDDANRIVDKKSIAGSSMSAEAWSSGDVKVSNDCRGSLAAVWAKRANGILNVTIAGACGDKVTPSGKNVGEYVVVLTARSTVQKGFDIQTQADVAFWLAKLNSVNVDAACCGTECASSIGSGNTASSADSETKELKKNSTVVLQAIMTERERLFSSQINNNNNNNNNGGYTSVATEKPVVAKEHEQSEKEKARAARKAKEEQEAAAEAEEKRKEKLAQAESAEKQRHADEDLRRAEAESKRKLEEEDRRAEAELKQKHDEEVRLAQLEKKQKADEKLRKAAEKEQRAAEKDQKAAEKERLAAIEKEQKQAERGFDKKKRQEEQKLADAKNDMTEQARKNQRLSREDAILAEATRQAELEQAQGVSPSMIASSSADTGMRTTRDDAILAEAARQVEMEQLQGIGPRIGGDDDRLKRDDAILAEATRQAEHDRREAADMRIPFSSYNSTEFKNSEAATVEIGDQQTALRPTPTLAGGNSTLSNGGAVASDSSTTNSSISSTGSATEPPSESLMQYPPPASPLILDPAYPTLMANREASKGWDSPGVPTDVQQPSTGATMVLPERAIAGQYITASVIDANHAGESGVELGFNGVSLATDAQGQVTFMVPEDAVPGRSLTVGMPGRAGVRPFPIEVLQPLTTASGQDAPSVDRTSPMVSSNGTVIIDGHNFDGRADRNKVLIDENTECKITAASPVQLRATLPVNLPPGVHFATVRCGNNKSNPGRFDLVTAEVQPDPKEAGKEQETKLVVKVLGTTNKVQVHLTNQNPDVIKISKGNDFRLTMPGGDNNSTIVSVQRLRKGSYRVVAVVE